MKREKLKAAPVCPTRKIFPFIFIVRLFFFRFGKKEEQSKATDNKINVDRITINEVGKKSIYRNHIVVSLIDTKGSRNFFLCCFSFHPFFPIFVVVNFQLYI